MCGKKYYFLENYSIFKTAEIYLDNFQKPRFREFLIPETLKKTLNYLPFFENLNLLRLTFPISFSHLRDALNFSSISIDRHYAPLLCFELRLEIIIVIIIY